MLLGYGTGGEQVLFEQRRLAWLQPRLPRGEPCFSTIFPAEVLRPRLPGLSEPVVRIVPDLFVRQRGQIFWEPRFLIVSKEPASTTVVRLLPGTHCRATFSAARLWPTMGLSSAASICQPRRASKSARRMSTTHPTRLPRPQLSKQTVQTSRLRYSPPPK